MAALIINPGIRWKSVVSFNARPPAAGEQGPVSSLYKAGWAPGLVQRRFHDLSFVRALAYSL